MLPPPQLSTFFVVFQSTRGSMFPKFGGYVQFLMRTRVDRIWQRAVRIVFI